MSNPVASFSGLASGIQWKDIVDQLMTVEESRNVTPITNRIDSRAKEKAAWKSFNDLTTGLNDAVRTLRAGGIGGFLATASASDVTSRTLVNATASSTAAPGSYKVEVLQLAQAAKSSGSTFANSKTALGMTGSFSVAGAEISVASTDTLENIRNKINTANSGTTPTGISASILSDGSSGGRLVLTRTSTGSTPISIEDGSGGIARELGFLNSSTKPVSSTAQAIASALGIQTWPAPASIRIEGRLISVDLEHDSLATVVAKINAAGGQARVESEDYGAETRYRLIAEGNVQAVDGDADSAAIISALGFGPGGLGPVQQTVATGAFSDAGNATATTSTPLAGLKIGGVSANLAVGDAINIRGTRGDGTAVSIGVTIQNGDTMQKLLDRINDATSGFGAGSRPASASLSGDGSIRLTDGTGGDSRLSLSLGVVRADGSKGTLGTPSVVTQGRQRELVKGQDAQAVIDGALVTRSTNSISDAISGVTLSLAAAEPGTEIDVTVNRNNDDALKAVKGFADAYNALVKFFDEQRASDGALANSASLRSVMGTFTTALRTQVAGNATYGRLSLMGVELDRTGLLKVDETKAKAAISGKPDEVEALFGFSGVGAALVTATDNATAFGTGTISNQIRSIDDQSYSLQARKTEAERRLALRRTQLTEQFTRMETALASLNSQSSYLTQQINSLNSA